MTTEGRSGGTADRMSGAALSIYVHLPYCARKCHYCDFNSRPAAAAERARYLEALKTEIDRRAETLGGSSLGTVFFGGGTPTVYEGEELAEVLDAVTAAASPPPVVRTPSSAHEAPPPPAPPPPGPASDAGLAGEGGRTASPSFVCRTGFQPVSRSVEITCEANPETVDVAKLRTMREAGFNRISIGAQSFDERELTMLGRGHSAEQTEDAVQAARDAGFEHVSLDLIYALPGQTVEGWRTSLLRALALQPEHVSAYGLELAEGTPLHARHEAGEIEPPEDAEHLAMRELTQELCGQAGLLRYEISNYALPGRECAHNMTYWRNEPYLGFGAGAWSYLDGVRSANLREPVAYCEAIEAGESPQAFAERLEPDDALAEVLMMGLRMTEGLAVEALKRAFGEERVCALLARAEPLAQMGLVALGDGRVRLTADGEPLHGEVCVRLV